MWHRVGQATDARHLTHQGAEPSGDGCPALPRQLKRVDGVLHGVRRSLGLRQELSRELAEVPADETGPRLDCALLGSPRPLDLRRPILPERPARLG